MASIFVATSRGCQVFSSDGEGKLELPGHPVWAIAPDVGGACVAVVDGNQIWRRSAAAEWSLVATADITLVSIVSVNGTIFAGNGTMIRGGTSDAVLVRVMPNNEVERVTGLDNTPGRATWVGNGPPLHVRSLTATADGSAIMAAVHVGGIPRTADGGKTWSPTIPIQFDVHEVRSHPSSPLVAAATAVGLCVSSDGGRNWTVIKEGLPITNSLAVAVLDDEILFSIQDGPFAERSQIWRWRIGGKRVEQVRQGLPEWLKGKVDTAHLAAGKGQAALVDNGGDLWLSKSGSTGWECVVKGLQDAFGIQIL
jgi:hypothetical protein